jgi:hypothetical protein
MLTYTHFHPTVVGEKFRFRELIFIFTIDILMFLCSLTQRYSVNVNILRPVISNILMFSYVLSVQNVLITCLQQVRHLLIKIPLCNCYLWAFINTVNPGSMVQIWWFYGKTESSHYTDHKIYSQHKTIYGTFHIAYRGYVITT